MITSFSDSTAKSPGPAWASWLGSVAIVLGIFLTAHHGNEVMKQAVISPQSAAARGIAAKCPEHELVEEGLSLAECEQMVSNVKDMLVSRPDWFRGFQMVLASIGAMIALASILIGIALVDYRQWAPTAAIVTFGALMLIDLAGFMAVVNSGPLLRQMYLWNILLWFFIHLIMTVGAVAGRHHESTD